MPYSQESPGAAGAKRVLSRRRCRSSRSACGISMVKGRISVVAVLFMSGLLRWVLVGAPHATRHSGMVLSVILGSMRTTSARLLALLGLLQSRPDWGGAELAARLGVTDRTVRNDMARLRDLGYPVDSVRGRGGRYRLGAGAKLPPLLLDDDEAVAVAVGLQAATGMAGVEETSARALTKLEHVLPDRLRRKVAALRSASSAGPANTDSDAEDPAGRRGGAERPGRRDPRPPGRALLLPRRAARAPALPPGHLAAALVPRSPATRRPAPGRRTASTGCGCAPPAAGRSGPSRFPAT